MLEREAAKFFSTAVFRPLASGLSSERADLMARHLRIELNLGRGSSNREVVAEAYELMRTNYRSEYFYRNLIASKIFVGRHRAANAVLLNELRIGESVADCVLVNGKGVVYEIKTEFDSPDKLNSQLENYYRAFPLVNVVTHVDQVERYLRALKDSPAGLIAVGTRDRLSIVKHAEPIPDSFNVRTMFNILRKHEVSAVLEQQLGNLPEVPNGLRYERLLELAERIPAAQFQKSMQQAIKARQLRNGRQMMLAPTLVPLRALVVQLDPDERQQENLATWLSSEGQ